MKRCPLPKPLLFCILFSLLTFTGIAQQPTWENGIACIIYSRCSPCHNPNGIAPFSLMSYEDAVQNVYGIKSTINSGEMPPYPPDRSYQRYQDERYLSDEEKAAINQWIKARVPAGDLSKAPTPPDFDYSAVITNPDFSSAIPAYTIPNNITEDLYRCFVLSNPLPFEQYIEGLEVIPGNRKIVHHVNIYQDTSSIPLQLDAADTLSGYTMFGGIGSESAQFIGSWVPGTNDAYFLPANMGVRINPGSRIIIQIHYPSDAAGEIDSTRINFKYRNDSRIRSVKVHRLLNAKNTLQNGPFIIAPNKVKKFYEKLVLPENENISILGIGPHAHLICKSMKAYAIKPGGDTVPLINIPKWDFHWQGAYMFKELITIPGGSTLIGEAVYDNTANNPHNPNNPPKRITLGESTTDEMMEFYFVFVKTKPGDDNIVFDTTTRLPTYNNCSYVYLPQPAAITTPHAAQLTENNKGNPVTIFPNPVQDMLNLRLNTAAPAKVLVHSADGKLVYATTAQPGNNSFDVQQIPGGIYIINIINQKVNISLRFIKK